MVRLSVATLHLIRLNFLILSCHYCLGLGKKKQKQPKHLARVRKTCVGLKCLFWSPASWMEIIWLPVKVTCFGRHVEAWRCLQVSWKNTPHFNHIMAVNLPRCLWKYLLVWHCSWPFGSLVGFSNTSSILSISQYESQLLKYAVFDSKINLEHVCGSQKGWWLTL